MHPFEERDFVYELIKENPSITTAQIAKARIMTGIMEWPVHTILGKLTSNAKVGSRRNGLSVEWFVTGWWDDPDKHCVPMGWDFSNIEKFWREYPEYRLEGY